MALYYFILTFIFTSDIDVILSSFVILNDVDINFLETSSILISGYGITKIVIDSFSFTF